MSGVWPRVRAPGALGGGRQLRRRRAAPGLHGVAETTRRPARTPAAHRLHTRHLQVRRTTYTLIAVLLVCAEIV